MLFSHRGLTEKPILCVKIGHRIFEESVYDFLQSKDENKVAQVGSLRFLIEIAIKDATQSSKFDL